MKVFLIGFMGSGKTYWGRKISQKLTIPFFDLDEQISNQEGKTITEIFHEKGEEHFRILEKEYLYILSESHETFIMATGGGTPCFFQNIDYMNQQGTTVWINPPSPILFERLKKGRDRRPLLTQLDDEQLKQYITKKIADRKIYYDQANIHVNDEDISMEVFLKEIFDNR